jgi:hypothetical protein
LIIPPGLSKYETTYQVTEKVNLEVTFIDINNKPIPGVQAKIRTLTAENILMANNLGKIILTKENIPDIKPNDQITIVI